MESPPESSSIRVTCLASFDFLREHFTEEKIRGLERALFETSCQHAKKVYVVQNWKSPQFMEIYKQHFRSIVSNLHPQSPVKNPRLLHRVLEGEFELSAIPCMTPYEMYPEKWFELKDKLMQREQKILEGNKSRATDQFKCRRCAKRECTYYEFQTRSADEPMTIFIMCLNCGKEWRQGG
jgi:transcription elongation factor S-II